MVWRLVIHTQGDYLCTVEKRFLQIGEEKARKNPEVVGWNQQYIFYLAEAGQPEHVLMTVEKKQERKWKDKMHFQAAVCTDSAEKLVTQSKSHV